jgi:hypothetical protein
MGLKERVSQGEYTRIMKLVVSVLRREGEVFRQVALLELLTYRRFASTFQYDTGQRRAMREMSFASEPTRMRESRRSIPRTIVSPAISGESQELSVLCVTLGDLFFTNAGRDARLLGDRGGDATGMNHAHANARAFELVTQCLRKSTHRKLARRIRDLLRRRD